MNIINNRKNLIITSVLVIILVAVLGYSMYLVSSNADSQLAKADTIGLNGTVVDGYTTAYSNATMITNN